MKKDDANNKPIFDAGQSDINMFEGTPVTIEDFLAWKRKFDVDKDPERQASL